MTEQTFLLERTGQNFDTSVLGNSRRGPVLADFLAAWAGPPLMLGADDGYI